MADLDRDLRRALAPYLVLLTDFVAGGITADEIELRYIELFSNDSTSWPDELFRALEEFFFAVDDYVADERLRSELDDIDANELRARAELTLRRLDAFT